jgi:hypothetical protein
MAAAMRGSGTMTSSKVVLSLQQANRTLCASAYPCAVVVCHPDSIRHITNAQHAGKGRFSYPDSSYFEGELGNGRRVHGQFVSGTAVDSANMLVNNFDYLCSDVLDWHTCIILGIHATGDGKVEYDGTWKQDTYHGKGVMVARDSWKFTGAR